MDTRLEPGLLCPITVGGPFELVGMDLLGPFPTSKEGNKNIIVATDYLTRWAECQAIPSGTSVDVARFFYENILCRYGAPSRILTDQGKCFESAMVREICTLTSTTMSQTSAYHPATN